MYVMWVMYVMNACFDPTFAFLDHVRGGVVEPGGKGGGHERLEFLAGKVGRDASASANSAVVAIAVAAAAVVVFLTLIIFVKDGRDDVLVHAPPPLGVNLQPSLVHDSPTD